VLQMSSKFFSILILALFLKTRNVFKITPPTLMYFDHNYILGGKGKEY
jgi:hypothetical protein